VALNMLGNVAHVFDTSREKSELKPILFEWPLRKMEIILTWVCIYISSGIYRYPNSLVINRIFFLLLDPDISF
jgi:hypothetical protein